MTRPEYGSSGSTSARELEAAVTSAATDADAVVMAAAVADFRPETRTGSKIKKAGQAPEPLRLVENPDILRGLSAHRARPGQVIVGFAAETEDLLRNGQAKLAAKGCDLLVVNQVGAGLAFGTSDNEAIVLGLRRHRGAGPARAQGGARRRRVGPGRRPAAWLTRCWRGATTAHRLVYPDHWLGRLRSAGEGARLDFGEVSAAY